MSKKKSAKKQHPATDNRKEPKLEQALNISEIIGRK